MRKGFVLCIVVIIVLSSIIFYFGECTTGQDDYEPYTSQFSMYEMTVYPPIYNGQGSEYSYPVINYMVSRDSTFVKLFEEIGIRNFESGIENQNAPTTVSHTDEYCSFIIHETPTTVIEFTAIQENSLKFILPEGTNALKTGSSVLIGNEQASGTFLIKGDVLVNIDGNNLVFDAPEGSSVIFRGNPQGEQVIGEAMSNNIIGGELFITNDGYQLVEDIVLFDDLTLSTISPAKDLIDLEIRGNLDYPKTVIAHVDREMLSFNTPEEIGIQIDGVYIERGEGLSETIFAQDENLKYYVTENSNGFDIIIYFPQISDHKITISGVEQPPGWDGFATLLSAVAIVGIAAAALFYNRD